VKDIADDSALYFSEAWILNEAASIDLLGLMGNLLETFFFYSVL
jgi:hypothetical protein